MFTLSKSVKLSPRLLLASVAVTAVASLGFVLSVPADMAFASENTPQSAVEQSIEHGSLMTDLQSGAITDDQLEAAASTGITVNGHHIDNWINLTPEQQKQADSAQAQLEADPALKAEAYDDLKGSVIATPSAPAADPSGITESKHWWNRFVPSDHWFHISGAVVKWVVVSGAAVAAASLCGSFDLSKVSCALVGVLFAGGSQLLNGWNCENNGLWIDVPYIWKSNCN
ncbi:hypothetical protein ITJ38_12765 [Agreia pratensis]|uniref:hypothetical protein n=1 Tax=Agreia pratensis TaxID=150121 RepID=UPI00188AFB7E|nr:hypothetical protein [Agreia pratensis]MBF4635279.1 hypothetical protein [Agreia pratensis]